MKAPSTFRAHGPRFKGLRDVPVASPTHIPAQQCTAWGHDRGRQGGNGVDVLWRQEKRQCTATVLVAHGVADANAIGAV